MKPEPGVAVIPQRAEPAEGQQAARTQKLAYAQGGLESPTLKLSGATLTSSIGDTGLEIFFPSFSIFFASAAGLDLLYTC